MPSRQRSDMASRNPTPWVSHRRIIVDVDEIDRQSIAEARSVRDGSNASLVQRPGDVKLPSSKQLPNNGKPVSNADRPKRPSYRRPYLGEIHATPAPEFFLGIKDRSLRSVGVQNLEEARITTSPRAGVCQSTTASISSSPQTASSLQTTDPARKTQESLASNTKELSHKDATWVYSGPSVQKRFVGRLTEHRGRQGRWYLYKDPGYPSVWSFSPEEHLQSPESDHSRKRQKKKSAKGLTSFLSLPGELRNRIYAYAVPECRILINVTKPNKEIAKLKSMWSEQDQQHKRKRTKLFHILDSSHIDQGFELTIALLSTCHAVRNDVEQYLYSRTTFCFDSSNVLSRFLNTASKRGLGAIRKTEISHQGYANPEETKDRIFREKYYKKWLQVCTQFGVELTGLEELKLKAILQEWPCEFASLSNSDNIWRKACLRLAPQRLRNVQVKLQHPMVRNNRNVLVDLAHALEDDMMTQEGIDARDNWEYEQVVNAAKAKRQAEKEAKAKAKRAELLASKPLKPLVITKEGIAAQTVAPVKTVSKGLDEYHCIDTGGMCQEELKYFKYQYCSEKHKNNVGQHI